MNAAELDAMLRQFLVDHRLSPTEQATLARWVKLNITNGQERALACRRLFEAARQNVVDPTALAVIGFLEDTLKVIAPTES